MVEVEGVIAIKTAVQSCFEERSPRVAQNAVPAQIILTRNATKTVHELIGAMSGWLVLVRYFANAGDARQSGVDAVFVFCGALAEEEVDEVACVETAHEC